MNRFESGLRTVFLNPAPDATYTREAMLKASSQPVCGKGYLTSKAHACSAIVASFLNVPRYIVKAPADFVSRFTHFSKEEMKAAGKMIGLNLLYALRSLVIVITLTVAVVISIFIPWTLHLVKPTDASESPFLSKDNVDALNKELESRKAELLKKDGELTVKENAEKNLKQDLTTAVQRNLDLTSQHNGEVAKLKAEHKIVLDSVKSDSQKSSSAKDKEIAELKAAHEGELKKAHSDYVAKIDEVETGLKKEITVLKGGSVDARITALEAKHKLEIETLQKTHSSELEKSEAAVKAAEAAIVEKTKELEHRRDAAVAEVREDFKKKEAAILATGNTNAESATKQIKDLTDVHEAAIAKLQATYDADKANYEMEIKALSEKLGNGNLGTQQLQDRIAVLESETTKLNADIKQLAADKLVVETDRNFKGGQTLVAQKEVEVLKDSLATKQSDLDKLKKLFATQLETASKAAKELDEKSKAVAALQKELEQTISSEEAETLKKRSAQLEQENAKLKADAQAPIAVAV